MVSNLSYKTAPNALGANPLFGSTVFPMNRMEHTLFHQIQHYLWHKGTGNFIVLLLLSVHNHLFRTHFKR